MANIKKIIFPFIALMLTHNICTAEAELYFSFQTYDEPTLVLESEPTPLFALKINKALDSDERTREKELFKLSLNERDGYIAEYYLTVDSLSSYSLEEQVDLLERFVNKGILNAKLDIANSYFKAGQNNNQYYVKAYELYKDISGSFPVALYIMALIGEKSDEVELSEKQIANLLLKAFKRGYQPALSRLSYYYIKGVEVDWDISYWSTLEKMNDPVALSNVGWAYFQGNYVKKDIKKSLELLKKSIGLKETGQALHNLGMIYWKETGQLNKAIKHFEKSLSKGYCYSALKLGIIYHYSELKSAIENYKRAIDCGIPEAEANLSILLLESGEEEKGLELLRDAADKGNISAMYNLGRYLMVGKYTEKNFIEGVSYLEKAAEAGHQKSVEVLISLSNTPEIKEYWKKKLETKTIY
ncbi:tetratricopeptide repeat protein [Kangiella shandongensis]|uniref:tetratricopeptide repeat protein n=1 Tax=Kangiella shandongensis TaxID=2763258 RepID=UPI001CBEACFD|nr:hypothetical protein [Kangiella shandongensis]